MEINVDDNQTDRKRKRKKSFFQQQTKFCKQGRYGKGTRLSQDNYEYFLRILEVMRKSEEEACDLVQLAESVFEESKSNEVMFSCNQLSSRVIEDLIPFMNKTHFEEFTLKLRENLRPVLSDPCASHVLEKLLLFCQEKITSESESDIYYNFVVVVSKFILNNLEEVVWEVHSVHVAQKCLLLLSGKRLVKDEIIVKTDDLSLEFQTIITEYTKRLMAWPQFSDLPNTDSTSTLIQSLLISNSTNKKHLKKLIRKLLSTTFNNSNVTNVPAVRVLETCVSLAPEKIFTQIYNSYFKNNLKVLSCCKINNYGVQKLLKHVHVKEEFEEMFVELCEVFDEILQNGFTGVLLSLTQTCTRLKTKQGDFIKMLSKTLNCFEPQVRNTQLVVLTCQLIKYDMYKVDAFKINLHGSLIIQEMLKFNKPILVVNSLLNMNEEQLVKILCDPCGCHITDVFLSSSYVGEKSREKLQRKLNGQYATLAKSKHGSRSLDSIWKISNMKQKMSIMNELKIKQSEIMSDKFGRGVAYRFKLDHFRHDKDNWMKIYSNKLNKEKLLEEIMSNV